MLTSPDTLNNYHKMPLPIYVSETGEKIDYSGIKYTCPKARWYNVFHDEYFIRNK